MLDVSLTLARTGGRGGMVEERIMVEKYSHIFPSQLIETGMEEGHSAPSK